MVPFWSYFVVVGLILQILFIREEYAENKTAALLLKGAAAFVFVCLGVVSVLKTSATPYSITITSGLFFGFLGDVLLNLPSFYPAPQAQKIFAGGIAAFLLGHLLYIVALILRNPASLYWAIPLSAVLSFFSIPILLRHIDAPEPKLKTFGIIYLVVINFMLCTALALLILEPTSLFNRAFTVGGALFTASDFVLIYNMFGKKKLRPLRAINLSLYYLGQLLIALTILLA